MKKLIALLALVSTSCFAQIESKEIDYVDNSRERPVKVRVWYQAAKGCEKEICIAGNNQSTVPVALLSHGAFGSPREMNWLGYGLASQGWLVVGVAHFGESWVYGRETIDYSSVGKNWLRAQDMHFVLDKLTEAKYLNKPVDMDKIVAVGHSLGGYTSFALAGADFNYKQMVEYCTTAIATDRGCRYGKAPKGKAAPEKHMSKAQLAMYSQDLTDNRIKAIIALDPALGPVVSQSRLSQIDLPVLVAGSVDNDFLSFDHHAKYYAENIKGAQLVSVGDGAGHFVYLDTCNHPNKAMGVSLCQDREGVDRKQVHHSLIGQMIGFLNKL